MTDFDYDRCVPHMRGDEPIMVTEFSIKGALEMERLLKELGPRVAARVGDQALRAAVKPIIKEAKRLVPKRTRKLEKSITAVVERHSKSPSERVILIGFERPRSAIAHLVEFGTSKMAARPFMRPALDAKASEALNEMGRVLQNGIEREAVKLATP